MEGGGVEEMVERKEGSRSLAVLVGVTVEVVGVGSPLGVVLLVLAPTLERVVLFLAVKYPPKLAIVELGVGVGVASAVVVVCNSREARNVGVVAL